MQTTLLTKLAVCTVISYTSMFILRGGISVAGTAVLVERKTTPGNQHDPGQKTLAVARGGHIGPERYNPFSEQIQRL